MATLTAAYDNSTDSAVVNRGIDEVVGISVPTGFVGTSLGIESSDTSGGTYQTLSDHEGNAIAITVAADGDVGLPIDLLMGAGQFIKFISDQTEDGVSLTIRTVRIRP